MINPSILRGIGWMLVYMGIFTINDVILVEYIRNNNKKISVLLYYIPVLLVGIGVVIWAHMYDNNKQKLTEDDTEGN